MNPLVLEHPDGCHLPTPTLGLDSTVQRPTVSERVIDGKRSAQQLRKIYGRVDTSHTT